MMLDDSGRLISSGIGAIVGFLLAQIFNIGVLIYKYYRKPILTIEHSDTYTLLSQPDISFWEEKVGEIYYGFSVKNTGRSVSRSVCAYLEKIEIIESDGKTQIVHNSMSKLRVYQGSQETNAPYEAVLPSKGRIYFLLAYTRTSDCAIFPKIDDTLDYYEDVCSDAETFTFHIIVFDERLKVKRETITLSALSSPA